MANSGLLSPAPKTAPARDRLLRAALSVFSRDGLHGATTRAIAEEAGVNEVTLFRLFGTKDGLLAALMSTMVAEAVNRSQPEGDGEKWGDGELRENLQRFAKSYYALLSDGEAFIRTMVGEARRYPDHARKMMCDAGEPLRARFVANLESARQAGKVRQGLDLELAADAFMDMLFSGMLRHTADFCVKSTPEDFLHTCSDIFAAGLAAPK